MFEHSVSLMRHQIAKVKKDINNFVVGESGMADAVEIVKGLVMIVVIGAIGVFIADQVVTTMAPSKRKSFRNADQCSRDRRNRLKFPGDLSTCLYRRNSNKLSCDIRRKTADHTVNTLRIWGAYPFSFK